MKLLIKQRVFSWTDTYDVYDEYDEPKYFVMAEMFRLTHQIHIYDRDRNEIGMIKQRFFTLYVACCMVEQISKQMARWGESIVIDYADPRNEILVLMLAIAIDAANCTQNNN